MKWSSKWLEKRWVANTIATCSAVVLFVLLYNLDWMFEGLGTFFSFLRPILLGIVIAYIFNPLANILDRNVLTSVKNTKTRWKIAVILSILVIVASITLLCVALVPQISKSVMTLASNMDMYLASLQELIHDLNNGHTKFFGFDVSGITSFGDMLFEKFSTDLSENMNLYVLKGADIGRAVFDVVIALILAIYFLLDKRSLESACAKFFSLLMKKESFDKTAAFLRRCNDILIRYISVDIVDGIIVGVVNFIFMLMMGMPYAVLISVIVGVTNLAPTFGPIVGGAMGAFILVLVNPWYALWFLVFTVILQTLDGYVIKPKLFGGSLGVSALMILISIILGGRLFGVAGILLAIPFAAIIDFTWRDFVLKKLEERHAKKYNI